MRYEKIKRISNSKRGFALLVAVIFMSVMLTFGLALSSLAYKQQILASSAIESQYAFYAADAGIECALYADQQMAAFIYPASTPSSAPLITCDGRQGEVVPAYAGTGGIVSDTASRWVTTQQLRIDNNKRCAYVTVYKPKTSGTTYIFSEGYDVSCDVVANPGTSRAVVRGLEAKF